MKVVLFAGLAQHGKDTSARMCQYYFDSLRKKSIVIHYADYLKFIAKEYFSWDGEKDNRGRTLLQVLGTEKSRANNPDIWVNVVIEFLKSFKNDYDYSFIADFRYPNEHTKLIEAGFDTFTVWIHRKNFDNGMTEEQTNHLSELSLLDYKFNYIISVDNEISELQRAVVKMIKQKEL